MSIKVRKLAEEPGEDVQEEGFAGVNSVWAVLKRDDLAAFSSRIFRVEPGGHTGMHAHERDHLAVVIKGTCTVEGDGEPIRVGEGNIVRVPPNVPHRFVNAAGGRLVLLIMNFFREPADTEEEAER